MSKSDMVYRYTASKIEYLHSIADTASKKWENPQYFLCSRAFKHDIIMQYMST